MTAKTRTRTRVEIACPHCGEGWARVDHLFGDPMLCRAGPWYCKDCGGEFSPIVRSSTDIDVEIGRSERTFPPCWDVLVLRPQDTPVYLIVRAKGCDARDALAAFRSWRAGGRV